MWDLHNLLAAPPSSDRPVAAVLAALFEDDDGEVRVLLTTRPDTMPTHAGHVAFPGGGPDPGDSGPVDTALREALEEVGLDPGSVEVLGFLPAIDPVEFPMLVVPVVGRVTPPIRLVINEGEVARIHTPRLADLADPGRWWSVPWNGHQLWYYDLDGDTLWGATAHMIRHLVGLE